MVTISPEIIQTAAISVCALIIRFILLYLFLKDYRVSVRRAIVTYGLMLLTYGIIYYIGTFFFTDFILDLNVITFFGWSIPPGGPVGGDSRPMLGSGHATTPQFYESVGEIRGRPPGDRKGVSSGARAVPKTNEFETGKNRHKGYS